MIVFRKQQHCADTIEQIAAIQAIAHKVKADTHNHEQAVELLMEMGELETAMTDFVCAEADFENEFTQFCRSTTLLAGKILCYSWLGRHTHIEALTRKLLYHLEKLVRLPLPQQVTMKVSEGFAYYGLYPETYIEAAKKFFQEHQPQSVVCIGLRSIGTALSAVVWAMLEISGTQVVSYTMRPRSQPFTRSPLWERDFKEQLLRSDAQYYIIVDEGPGLSGSSICGVARQLESSGIDIDRIVVFPSWTPAGDDFVNPEAQEIWPRLRKFCCGFEETWLRSGRLTATAPECMRDISAGNWRGLFYEDQQQYPAIHPHHEKRKYLCGEAAGKKTIYKFQGLGKYGQSKFRRAEILREAGFGPQVLAMVNGFSKTIYLQGTPVRIHECDKELLDRMASYLAFIKNNFTAPRAVDFDYMCHVIENNVTKSIGAEFLKPFEKFRKTFESAAAYELDARMFSHEWMRCGDRYIKTDGESHYHDHFFPGPADIAWDIAGTIVEFKLNNSERIYFIEQYGKLAHDHNIHERLEFATLSYLAFRIGYATFAYQQFGTTLDGEKFRLMAHRYERLIKFHLARL